MFFINSFLINGFFILYKMNGHTRMGTQGTGNTKAVPCLRARSFQFTFNDIDTAPEIIEHFKNLKKCDYGIACHEEAPTTGHEHIHLYVHLYSPYTLPKKVYESKCHIEICRGSPKQNIDYIKKNGDVIDEWGDEPHQGLALTIADLKEIKNPEQVNWNQYKTWLSVKNNDIDVDEMKKDVEVYFIFGPSGIGKTEKAKEIIRNNKDKYGTKLTLAKYDGTFWHNVHSDGTILLYDDFRDSHMKASEFINLIDYNIQPMNIKGSTVMNNYKLIIITSIQNPKFIYSNMDDEPRKQWIRRINIIDLNIDDKNTFDNTSDDNDINDIDITDL